jgi:DNA-binding Xre family transcriptional regulator
MIKFTLGEMLEKRGLSAYALYIKSDKKLHQSVIGKIRNNESKALNLDSLDMICEFLECQPADLITYENGKVARATQNTKHTQNKNTTQSASDNEYNLSSADAGKMLGLKPRTVTEKAKYGLLKGKLIKRHWFFRTADVQAFKAQRDKE